MRRGFLALPGILILWASPHLAPAASPPEERAIFAAGNDQYAAGKFEEAARHYRQLLNQGFQSEAVHYNLGNALFKMGQIGQAILQYEKAAALAPNDPDVRENLEFLRTLTVDRSSGVGAQTTAFFVERLLALTTVDQDAGMFGGIFALIGVLAGVLIVSGSPRLRAAMVWGIALMSLPLLLVGISFGVKLHREATVAHAVVLQEKVDVRSGPGEENTTLFTVHEGLKVRLRSEQGSWYQVSLESGLSGWVPAPALGVI